jgi:multidrug resistance efflux pump
MTEEAQQAPQDSKPDDSPVKTKQPTDPVRRWTLIVLAICVLLLAWYLRADRVTPYTSQARVNALVVPIASEVSGTVSNVFVDNNQSIEAGQKLFQIDIERYKLGVQNAEATVASAKASMQRAKLDAIRMRNIRKEDPGAISERRLESAEASFAATVSHLSAAKANLDKSMLDLERATVRAPEDGVVTGVRLDKGNYAAAGAPQLTFIATHNIWVQAEFTENNLGNIDPGDEVAIVFDALPGQIIRGSVREVGFGVAVDSAPLGSLPTIQNDPDWLRESQRYSVFIDFELTPEQGGRLLKVGSQASVIVYTGQYWLSNKLASLVIRLVSILTYAY